MRAKRVVRPKGILMPIGGGEDSLLILERIIKETGKKKTEDMLRDRCNHFTKGSSSET